MPASGFGTGHFLRAEAADGGFVITHDATDHCGILGMSR